MCGIAGGVNIEADYKFLLNSLKHRGPDDWGKWESKNLFLFHTRLAIQDIKQGRQPFEYKDFLIVFNGEIYNHLKLRKHYLQEFKFKTNCDTEALLYLYIKYKEKMFDKIDGMFAFCIFDRKENKLFLAKDRAGKKPLFYYKKGDKFFFASELKAFKFLKNIYTDEESIYTYLRTGFFPFEYTPFKGVKNLRNGSFLVYDLGNNTIKTERYFDIENYYRQDRLNKNEDEILEVLDEKLTKSIKDRMLASDLEVGAFLSGGIDSSLVVAVASQFTKRLKTFTVKFERDHDESHLAKLTSQMYSTDHTEIEITMNLKSDIEKILSNYGMPFMDSSAIPSYYVSREAKRYITVVLNGDGADELFGGYRRYVPVANRLLRHFKKIAFLFRMLPPPKEKQSHYNYLYRLASMSNKEKLDLYLSATTDVFEDVYEFKDTSQLNKLKRFVEETLKDSMLTDLSKFLYLDFELILFSDLLIKMDIATMANSLEARSPFLSKNILEFAPLLEDNLKVKKTTTKYILRKLAEKYLHKKLIKQPKRGFEVPLKKWVNNELKEAIFDYLQKGCYSENFINRGFIDGLLENRIRVSEEKRAKMLWSMFCLEVWKRNL